MEKPATRSWRCIRGSWHRSKGLRLGQRGHSNECYENLNRKQMKEPLVGKRKETPVQRIIRLRFDRDVHLLIEGMSGVQKGGAKNPINSYLRRMIFTG